MLAASSGHTSQSLADNIYAFKYFLVGQGISYVIIKATTTELIGPKKKHLKYLIAASYEPNVSIPSMVKHLVERAKRPEWEVVFKSLITIHQLMLYGSENFLNCFCSSVAYSDPIDRLCRFDDTSSNLAYRMSKYLRRYSRYISLKLHVHRTLGLEFCRIVPTIRMRELTFQQLIKSLPIISALFDTILGFDVAVDDLSNGIINSGFVLLYTEFVKIYIVYQAAILRYLEVYFDSNNPKIVRQMLPMYKKYLVRMEKMSDFMPVINAIGLDKKDLPKFDRVPKVHLQLLEQHLDQLEGSSKRSLGRLDYGTLARPRSRIINTPTRTSIHLRTTNTPTRQTSIDILSPATVRHFKQHNEELKRLDKMLGVQSDESSKQMAVKIHINPLKRGNKFKSNEDIDEVATVADESSFMTHHLDEDESCSTDNSRRSDNPVGKTPVYIENTNLIDLPNTTDARSRVDASANRPIRNYHTHNPASDGYDQLLDKDIVVEASASVSDEPTRMLKVNVLEYDDHDDDDYDKEEIEKEYAFGVKSPML